MRIRHGVVALAVWAIVESPMGASFAAASPVAAQDPVSGQRPVTSQVSTTPAADAARALWRDPTGAPLPFSSGAEAVEFLRTATVVSSEEIPEGSTKPLLMLLERNGVQARAIFRSFERMQERVIDPDSGQTRFRPFRDSSTFEAAAYDLATLLGLPFVPPTVRRVIDNRDGTLQLWIESAMSEKERQERGIAPPNEDWWRGVLQTLVIFDNLIFNADRNTGNMLIDPAWRVWFIDHTRSFQENRGLRNPEYITFCERRLFERLQGLSDDEIRDAMQPYLDGREIGALLRRRERIVELINKLIEENGAGAVLFTYSYDLADWPAVGR
ncbi:MAG: hypothetical protein PVJ49_02640 [Acidobacteriota bacterium]|jgi:hypothetical protein